MVGERRRCAGSARKNVAEQPDSFLSRSKSVRRAKHGRRGDTYVGSAAGRGRDHVRYEDMPRLPARQSDDARSLRRERGRVPICEGDELRQR